MWHPAARVHPETSAVPASPGPRDPMVGRNGSCEDSQVPNQRCRSAHRGSLKTCMTVSEEILARREERLLGHRGFKGQRGLRSALLLTSHTPGSCSPSCPSLQPPMAAPRTPILRPKDWQRHSSAQTGPAGPARRLDQRIRTRTHGPGRVTVGAAVSEVERPWASGTGGS